MNSLLRTALVLSLAAAALAANAQTIDAYSGFPATGAYRTDNYFIVGAGFGGGAPTFAPAFQFTAGAGGAISTFRVAMNNAASTASSAYSLSLYADNGSNQLGTLMGTYSGLSTGTSTGAANNYPVSTVVATNAPSILSGAKYWLMASSTASLGWSASSVAPAGLAYAGGSNTYFSSVVPGAFSVQVVSQANPTPEPSALAALGLGAVGLLRRRRK